MADSITPERLTSWLEIARDIASDAGMILMRGWRSGPLARTKSSDIDLVTDFDLESEELIKRRMSNELSDHAVVAEESAGDAPLPSGLVWLCDPLDGTTNFAHGHFVFSVSLGLALDGEPRAGVVHAPALGITWHGGVGIGAFRNGAPCRVSATRTLGESIVATGFPYDRARNPDNNLREVGRVLMKVQGIRRIGSAAVDLSLVADGTYDGYWEQRLKPWDLCAGAAIVQAAGGVLTDYDASELRLSGGRVVATNGRIHGALCEEITAART